MKAFPWILGALGVPFALSAADPNPKETVVEAAKKLADQPNYAWKTTVVVPESARFKPGPTDGKTEKDGYTHATTTFGPNPLEIVRKGEKACVTDMDGNWRLASDLESEQGPGRFFGTMARNLKAPAAQALEWLETTPQLKKDAEIYSAELTAEGLKKQFRFGEPKNPKGEIRFWIRDGVLSKFETKVEAKMAIGGEEFDASRTTTVEIKDVGTTKISVPEAAKKLVGP